MSTGEPPPNKPAWLMTPDEIEASIAGYEGPDRTPLTDAEKADLRRRLNAPGKRPKLSYRESAALWGMGIIRYPEDVAALYREVKAEHTELRMSRTSREFGEGILAAIEWATGATANAPVTGDLPEHSPPSTGDMSREEEAAGEAAAGRRRCARGRNFAVGVEHALMWLLARTDTRPWGRLHDQQA